MPRRKTGRPPADKPKYCLDKPSQRAFVTIAKQRVYLGRYGSRESRDKYDRLIGEWIAKGRPRILPDADEAAGPTVTQIILAFWAAAPKLFPRSECREGRHPTGELGNYFDVLKPLRRLYGPTPAREFGPVRLKAFREALVRMGWTRGTINKQISRAKRVIAWAVEEELLPGEVDYRLRAVKSLKLGKTEAPEPEPIKPVAEEIVAATLPFLSRQVRAMVQLQHRSGMRPGEVVMMRTGDIDRSGELWTYSPQKHKTAHHGHKRVIYLGPKAQQVLKPFMSLDPTRYLFSPSDADTDRREKRHARRKTPLSCGNVPGSNRSRSRSRQPGAHYTVASYRRAIQRACDAADRWHKGGMIIGNNERVVPRWHPHQLRHTAGSDVRKEFGAEAAQTILGHKHLKTTEIYAEKNLAAARKIMQQIG